MSNWLAPLRSLFEASEEELPDPDLLPRAAAVLLLEIGLADDAIAEAELRQVAAALGQHFGLDAGRADAMIAQARELLEDVHSLHEYTHALRTGMESRERAELIESLWSVAFADGTLDRHEEHLIRRLADLLGVPHREFMRRKHRAGSG